MERKRKSSRRAKPQAKSQGNTKSNHHALHQTGTLVQDLQDVLVSAKAVYDAVYKQTHGKSFRQGAVALSRAVKSEIGEPIAREVKALTNDVTHKNGISVKQVRSAVKRAAKGVAQKTASKSARGRRAKARK